MSNWQSKKILVTGADGFIGSHLAETLVRKGADVTALVLYNSFDSHGWLDEAEPDVASSMRMVRGDIRDAHQMTQLAQGQDIVFHLAALIAIPHSYEAPTSYVQTNVQGTTNVLLAARNADCARVVHTSTSEVYGSALFTPITEEHPLHGQSPYSASKIGADMIAESFYRSFELPVVTLRPFNTYGPRQSERAVISAVIRQVLDDNCASIELGDLTPSRDFNFVSDTVEAFMAVSMLDDTHCGQAFNAGSGKMITIAEIVETVVALSGSDKPVSTNTNRMRPANSEVMALMADTTRLNAASGWSPTYDLNAGLAETINWWRERLPRVRRSAGYAT